MEMNVLLNEEDPTNNQQLIIETTLKEYSGPVSQSNNHNVCVGVMHHSELTKY